MKNAKLYPLTALLLILFSFHPAFAKNSIIMTKKNHTYFIPLESCPNDNTKICGIDEISDSNKKERDKEIECKSILRLAFDMGSGATKTQLVEINNCTLEENIKTLHKYTHTMPYQYCIEKNKGLFAEECEKEGLNSIIEILEQYKKYNITCGEKNIECGGIATAWARNPTTNKFRKEVLGYLKKLKDTKNIYITPITQKEEGEIEFLDVEEKLKLIEEEGNIKPLILGIGGGSTQISFRDKQTGEAQTIIIGGQFGRGNFKYTIEKAIDHYSQNDNWKLLTPSFPEPQTSELGKIIRTKKISNTRTSDFLDPIEIKIAKQYLNLRNGEFFIIKNEKDFQSAKNFIERNKKNITIIGIGGLINHDIKNMVSPGEKNISVRKLNQLLSELSRYKTLQDAKKKFPFMTKTGNDYSLLLLIYILENLGINEIQFAGNLSNPLDYIATMPLIY